MRASRPTHPTASGPASPPVDNPALRPLLLFVAVALPMGWIALSLPIVLDLPMEPFVLLVTFLGLLLPALVLTARESGRDGVRALLLDAVRLPRPLWWLLVAIVALPVLVWTIAAPIGGAEPVTASLLAGLTVQLVTGAVIINLWEELAWTGFVQRRSMARWGPARGSVATALLFAGIHLPLAWDGADTAADVLTGVGVLLAIGIGLRLLIARLDRWTGRSILTIGLLHASFNTTAEVVDPGYDWIRLTLTVLLGLVAFGVGASVVRTAAGRHRATAT
jgi:membrane protease YdiL (CAAX protease family)